MKNLLLIALLFASLRPSFAQKIHFANSANVWCQIDSTNVCCIPSPVHYTTAQYEDSLVYNGHFYRYLHSSLSSFLIREDSNRVYVIGTADSVERLLYDFNLTLNDTLRVTYPEDTFTSWVTRLDYTQMAGYWYKVWHFDGQDASSFYPDSIRQIQYNVIEGIGCTNGPYFPASPYSLVGFSQQLQCFKSDAGVASLSIPVASYGYTYTLSFDNDISCDTFTSHHQTIVDNTGVKGISEEANEAKVIPNPIAGIGKIVMPYNISKGTLTIVNVLGQIVYNADISNCGEVPLSGMSAAGVYYYRVSDIGNGSVLSGKFVRQ